MQLRAKEESSSFAGVARPKRAIRELFFFRRQTFQRPMTEFAQADEDYESMIKLRKDEPRASQLEGRKPSSSLAASTFSFHHHLGPISQIFLD